MSNPSPFPKQRGTETPKQFTASDARQLVEKSRSLDGDYMRMETDLILENIKLAAKQGSSTITSNVTDDVVIDRLSTLGFKCGFRDSQTIITW